MAIIEIRQVRVVTQILTRASTTITTIVTLGNDPALTPSIPSPTPNPPAPAAPPQQPDPSSTSSPALTNEQLGAILGSVLGFVFIILPLCYCCVYRPGRRRYEYDSTTSSDGSGDDDDDDDDSSPGRRPRRVRVGRVGRAPMGRDRDPFRGMPPVREAFQPVLIPPPPRIPPKRYAPYRQTAQPQISGVRIYP